MAKENYSVLMSVYRNEKPGILRESMQSIFDQTVPTNDFVLICDGPLTKRLDDVIEEMQKKFGKRLRVIRHDENHGLGYCLRTGINECKNDLVARMDSDDISRNDRCEKQLKIFADYPDVSVVGGLVGDFKVTTEKIDSIRKVPETNEEIIKFVKWRSPMNHPSVMFRKKDVLAVGNYPEVRNCQDWYLWTTLLMNGYKLYNVQEILVYMREDNTTFKRRSGWRYFKIQKNLYDKMRKAKFISIPQYATAVSVRFCSAMAPNGMRQAFFKKFMREKVANEGELNAASSDEVRGIGGRNDKSEYKYVIFAPYFGKLPVNFDLWLESCSYNKRFKFIVFTDDKTKYDVPRNVEIVDMSFNEFRKRIQEKFDFKISLDKPYKLCDYKPAYGHIFSGYIKGYEYWGYCDLDLIFGDIEKFLPKEHYDKISYHGHFCLYRNQPEICTTFMDSNNGSINYEDILSHSQSFAFDEIGDYGINKIFERKGLKIYDLRKFAADVDCRRQRMYCRGQESLVGIRKGDSSKRDDGEKLFIFDAGKVYSYSLKNKKIDGEYIYIHLQKRKMRNIVKNKKKYIITYNSFMDYPVDEEQLQNYSPRSLINLRWFKVKINTTPRRIKRELAIARLKLGKGRLK